MASCLVISVRLHEGRYHGVGDWPPAPARLFQALIAGAGLSGPLEHRDSAALAWVEKLSAPVIGAPPKTDGQSVTLYVPNNDLDSVGGDPRRIAEIRGSQKIFKPRLFQKTIPFVYAWTFEEDENSLQHTPAICDLAERLYQFGRGVDFACAWGEVLDEAVLREQLFGYPGFVHRPSLRGTGVILKCPTRGSLKSLDERYRAFSSRFGVDRGGRTNTPVFTKVPSARFAPIAYDSPERRYVFELRSELDDTPFAAWPLAQTARLVELLRDGAVARLGLALPSLRADIERVLIGRKPDGSNDGPSSDRVRILPLPSIGHYHADRGTRRVVVEIPPNCPLQADDVAWSFSGMHLQNANAPQALRITVTSASMGDVENMLTHYGIDTDKLYRIWRTVTPLALPESAARRRIDPNQRPEAAKRGAERTEERVRAAGAVMQALRHAGVRSSIQQLRLQREPFDARGERVEMFAEGTRFSKHRLWHAEIQFADGIRGPLVIGDGRFLGLGIMAPGRYPNPEAFGSAGSAQETMQI